MPLDVDTVSTDAIRRALHEVVTALMDALRPSGLSLTPALISALHEARVVLRTTHLGLPVSDRS